MTTVGQSAWKEVAVERAWRIIVSIASGKVGEGEILEYHGRMKEMRMRPRIEERRVLRGSVGCGFGGGNDGDLRVRGRSDAWSAGRGVGGSWAAL